jgi:hypothetical protein
MAAKFRHQSAAGLVIQTPVNQLLRAVVAQFFKLAGLFEFQQIFLFRA